MIAITLARPFVRALRLVIPLLLALATPRSASAFRSAAELPKLNSPIPVRYGAATFDYWIVRPSIPRSIADFQPQDIIVEAAQRWAEPVCSGARPQLRGLGTDPAVAGDGVNTVEWVADWEARGFDPQAAGYTDVQFSREEGGNWTIAEADIYLNASFEWSLDDQPPPPLRSVRAVVTHEFGHAFGLLHPCEIDDEPRCTANDDAGVTMYPVYSPEQADLAPDDVQGICFLYPVPDCTVTGCDEGFTCSGGACRAECGPVLCEPGSICSAGNCQVPSPCPEQTCIGHLCSKDSQCGLFEHCGEDGRCIQGTRSEGQACADSTQCARGLCFEGVCRNRCMSAGDCAANHSCEPADEQFSACVPVGSPIGDTCASPLDCKGSRCLLNAKPNPVCTQPCGSNYPLCPVGWACGSADGESVCVPVRPTGGCTFQPVASAGALSPVRSSSTVPEIGALLTAFTLSLVRRRRRSTTRLERTKPSC